MWRLHSAQPSSSLEQHILNFVHKLETDGSVLSNDVILCFTQATQLYNEGIVVIERPDF